MGANLSTSINEVKQTNINKVISKNVQKASNVAQNESLVSNVNEMMIEGDLNLSGGCSLSMMNIADIKQVTTAELNSKQLSKMKDELKTQFKSSMDKKAKQVADAGLSGNATKTVNRYKAEIINVIDTTFSVENYNEAKNSAVTVNDNKLQLSGSLNCEEGASFDQTNKAIVSQIARALTKSLQKNIKENEILAKAEGEYKEVVDQKIEGLFGMLGKVGLVFIIIAGLVLWKLGTSPAGQAAIKSKTGGGISTPIRSV